MSHKKTNKKSDTSNTGEQLYVNKADNKADDKKNDTSSDCKKSKDNKSCK